jgi:hypothetical protein
MVSREDRDALIAAIRRYTSEQISALDFDEALSDIRDQTTDETVQFATQALWLFYDDLKDHKIVATKAEWDLFQRVLLLLHSDAELVFSSQREWTIRQPLAAFALAGFVGTAFHFGIGYQLIAVVLSFGLISILLAQSRVWFDAASKGDWRRFPFSSLAEIRTACRQCPSFRKQPYPKHLQERRIRAWTTGRVMAIPWYVLWAFLAPLALIFQMLPEKQRSRRMIFSADTPLRLEEGGTGNPSH